MHYDPGEFEEPSDVRWAASNVPRQATRLEIRRSQARYGLRSGCEYFLGRFLDGAT